MGFELGPSVTSRFSYNTTRTREVLITIIALHFFVVSSSFYSSSSPPLPPQRLSSLEPVPFSVSWICPSPFPGFPDLPYLLDSYVYLISKSLSSYILSLHVVSNTSDKCLYHQLSLHFGPFLILLFVSQRDGRLWYKCSLPLLLIFLS